MSTNDEAAWRRRYRAPVITLPQWAREEAERAIYLSNASGKFEWYAWDRTAGTHRQVTDRPEGTRLAQIEPTGQWVWWFDDKKGNEKEQWVGEPFAGTGDRRLIDLPPAYASGAALGASAMVIGVADKGVHSVHVVRDGERPSPIYEHREAVSVGGMSRDESLVVLAHSEHGDSRNRALRVIDLEGRAVGDLWDGPGMGLSPGSWSRVKGDRRLIVSHDREGVARPAIWHPESGELFLLELDGDFPGEIGAGWYPDASALLLRHFSRGRTQLYRLPLDGSEAAGPPERVDVEPGVVSAAAIRPDGELWYAITSSSSPPVVHCGDEVLRPPGERAPGGVAYRDVEVGPVHAFLAEPAGPAPHPTVFQVHGGPTGVDADTFSASVQAWVDHGFAVVLVNYRGSSGYGKTWRDAIVGQPGLREIEDIAEVRERLVADGVVDPDRVVLSGGSWGGYLTLLGLGRQPELWSLGISGVPLADLKAHYDQQSTPLQAYWRALFGGTPEELGERLAEISPIEFADRIAVPLLILAGDNDPRCPIGQVMNYVERLEALGKRHELYRYDAGHGALVIEEQIRQKEMAIDFAARHLGTQKPL